MKILVINTGSSSLKYQLFDMAANPPVPLASGLAERIGEPTGALTYKKHPGAPGEQKIVQEGPLPDHEIALQRSIEFMTGPETGVIADVSDILAIGHRIVSGGEYFLKATVVEDWVEKGIEACIPLAPLHNPSHLVGIKVSQRLFPKALQVVVPDTAFHQTMPPEVFLYALPYKYYKEMHIRRYGAHGTSHLFVSKEAAKFLGKGPDEANLITLHLGNGSSITAVKDGKCLDTSMGMTPLAGVIMGSRTGDLDPAIPPFIMRQTGMSPEAVDDLMNKGSGFKGLCGSGDMRDIHRMAAEGDDMAKLALAMFVYRNKKYIGSYMAVIGKVDALVFTAGIGENDTIARAKTCEGLEHLGIILDPAKNEGPERGIRRISTDASPVAILVVPTNEELEIASQTLDVFKKQG